MISGDERLRRRRAMRRALAETNREASRTLERFDCGRVQDALAGLEALADRMERCRELARRWLLDGAEDAETAIGVLRRLGRELAAGDDAERDLRARVLLPGAVIEAMEALRREMRPGAWGDALYALGRRLRVAASPRNLLAAVVGCALIIGMFHITEVRRREARLETASTLSLNLMDLAPRAGFSLGGLLSPERSSEGTWRWGLGPKTLAAFTLAREKEVVVSYAFSNPQPGQDVTILGNGVVLKKYENLPAASWLAESVRGEVGFKGIEGVNVLEIDYSKWNHNGALMAPDDRQWYAVAFTRFRIETR